MSSRGVLHGDRQVLVRLGVEVGVWVEVGVGFGVWVGV